MAGSITPLFNEPDDKPQAIGNVKVTREDWLNIAMDTLISDGVEQVKVLVLGDRLGVSRSSFYWYFKSRQDLLDALLRYWDRTNTAALVRHAELPAATITEAVFNVFRCFLDETMFSTRLDFAVRDWARRSGKVRRILDQSDQTRIGALKQMFLKYGFEEVEAFTRARILYYMQIGYNAAELNESIEERMRYGREYVLGFTGIEPRQTELDAISAFGQALIEREEK